MPPNSLRPPSLSDHPGYLAAQVAKSASRMLGDALLAYAVRPHHYAVLAALSDFGPQCQQDLCDTLDLDKSHMVGFVDDLESMGHVTRARDVQDRRRHRVLLTESGGRLLVELREVQARYEADLFATLDATERRQLNELLTRVVAHADSRRLSPDGPPPDGLDTTGPTAAPEAAARR